jgi:hypothetical protein
VIAVASEPIRLHTHDKMSSQFLGQTVKFKNVALAIADVDTAGGFVQKSNRLPQIIQPPHAFFLFDRNSRRIDFPLKRRCPLEFLAGPKFHRS